jgi:hypothetical protein
MKPHLLALLGKSRLSVAPDFYSPLEKGAGIVFDEYEIFVAVY